MKEKIFLIIIVIIAIFFRFNNLNWDSGFHLHPDERFLTMVGNDMKIPANFSDYLNPQTSTLNPANLGYKFFVYGVFPITLNKILAVIFNNDNYNAFTIQGRFLSALFDLFIVVLVYKTAKLLFRKLEIRNWKLEIISLWSAFFYAIAVLPIQLSHFFAVDTFLNFFMFASFYFVLKFYSSSEAERSREANIDNSRPGNASASTDRQNRTIKWLIISAIFFGLALASKITAVFILPLNLFFLFYGHSRESGNPELNRFRIKSGMTEWLIFFLPVIIYLLLSYFTLRLADPYMFQNTNIFDPTLSQTFINNLKELKTLTKLDPNNFYPPMVQWLNKNTVIHSLVNNVVFGLGLLYSVFVLVGVGGIILKIKNQISKIHIKNQKENTTIKQLNNGIINNKQLTIIMLWAIGLFSYQSLQTTPTLRYFIIIYPFLAIFAGIGIVVILNLFQDLLGHSLRSGMTMTLIIILLIWPIMFTSIYRNKHSRVVASEWIFQNVKNGAVILNEHWDDGLPLPMENNYGKQFELKELPVFGVDDDAKWTQMNELLEQGDYYILSSNRGWGSISTVPEKYPKMTKFYKDLFTDRCHSERGSESICFKKMAEFTSYPRLEVGNWELEVPDDWADEGFTVYDHPKVLIYKNVNKNNL